MTRLLVVTQAVDSDDPVLGFFVRWIEELSKRCDQVTVICLKKGNARLPGNVRVYSLGKEKGKRSRASYAYHFLSLVWKHRGAYDTVFVHMNQEYMLLAGALWQVLGKSVCFWRNHVKGSVQTVIACSFADVLFYTSPQAYIAQFRRARQMPIGIDTATFMNTGIERTQHSILFLARLDPVKHLDAVLAAAQILSDRDVPYRLNIYGAPTAGREAYAQGLREQYRALEERGSIVYHGPLMPNEIAAIYAANDVFVNVTPTGSFDKTIGEAMAAGCLVVSCNEVIKEVLTPALFCSEEPESIASALTSALTLSEKQKSEERIKLQSYARHEHDLGELIERVTRYLTGQEKITRHPPRPLRAALIAFSQLQKGHMLTFPSVLMYHSISDVPVFFSVAPPDFERQMRYLQTGGYTTMFASEIVDGARRKTDKTICVTFDDGYADNYRIAFPILKRYGIKATIFIITSDIGKTYESGDRSFRMLDKEEIREMQESGFIEFATHSHTHPAFSKLSIGEAEHELTHSRAILTELTGTDVPVFAYPKGKLGPDALAALTKSRFKAAFTVRPGLLRANTPSLLLPRNSIDSSVTFNEFTLKVSDAFETYLTLRTYLRSLTWLEPAQLASMPAGPER